MESPNLATPASTTGSSASSIRRYSTEAKAKRTLNFGGPQAFVTILVGPEAQKFVVHKSAICHHSPFFEKAFSTTFIEGQTQEMTLEDVGVETFNLLVNWLYTQKVEHAEKKIEHVELYELCKLWSLGERFLMPKLQNDAMRVMVTRDCAGEYSEEPTEYAYNAYAEDAKSPLKRIFVLRAVSGMRTAAKAKKVETWVTSIFGRGFQQDVMNEILSRLESEFSGLSIKPSPDLFLVEDE